MSSLPVTELFPGHPSIVSLFLPPCRSIIFQRRQTSTSYHVYLSFENKRQLSSVDYWLYHYDNIQKLFWETAETLLTLNQSSLWHLHLHVLLFPFPATLGKLIRDSWGALVNKALPVVSSSCLGCALICVRRGWHVSAAHWADRQLTDIHNLQTVKLQLKSRFSECNWAKITCCSSCWNTVCEAK